MKNLSKISKMIQGSLPTITVLVLLAGSCSGLGLSVGDIKCGQLVCNNHEYCSEIDNRCTSCVSICDPKNHNFDPAICFERCQDYLHDLVYVRKDYSGSGGKSESTNLLMILIVILYIFVTVLFIIKLLENYSTIKSFFVRMWESVKRQCAISKKSSQNQVPNVLRPGPVSSINVISPQSTSMNELPSMQRQAAEDSPVDHSYDNMASDTTPPPNPSSRRQPLRV